MKIQYLQILATVAGVLAMHSVTKESFVPPLEPSEDYRKELSATDGITFSGSRFRTSQPREMKALLYECHEECAGWPIQIASWAVTNCIDRCIRENTTISVVDAQKSPAKDNEPSPVLAVATITHWEENAWPTLTDVVDLLPRVAGNSQLVAKYQSMVENGADLLWTAGHVVPTTFSKVVGPSRVASIEVVTASLVRGVTTPTPTPALDVHRPDHSDVNGGDGDADVEVETVTTTKAANRSHFTKSDAEVETVTTTTTANEPHFTKRSDKGGFNLAKDLFTDGILPS